MQTEDSSRAHSATLTFQKQVNDDDFILDQGFSTGVTDRMLSADDRETIAKAHDEENVARD